MSVANDAPATGTGHCGRCPHRGCRGPSLAGSREHGGRAAFPSVCPGRHRPGSSKNRLALRSGDQMGPESGPFQGCPGRHPSTRLKSPPSEFSRSSFKAQMQLKRAAHTPVCNVMSSLWKTLLTGAADGRHAAKHDQAGRGGQGTGTASSTSQSGPGPGLAAGPTLEKSLTVCCEAVRGFS